MDFSLDFKEQLSSMAMDFSRLQRTVKFNGHKLLQASKGS
jgi:hypothetical protein